MFSTFTVPVFSKVKERGNRPPAATGFPPYSNFCTTMLGTGFSAPEAAEVALAGMFSRSEAVAAVAVPALS